MANLAQFSQRMRVIADNIPKNVDREVKRVAIAADQTVVLATPVDKGIARSNWLVSTGQSRNDQVAAYAPGNKLGLSETKNAQAAIDQGRRVIASRKNGEDIHITNNVEYIGKLNEGSSLQAPANFVLKALEAAASVARNARVLIRRGN